MYLLIQHAAPTKRGKKIAVGTEKEMTMSDESNGSETEKKFNKFAIQFTSGGIQAVYVVEWPGDLQDFMEYVLGQVKANEPLAFLRSGTILCVNPQGAAIEMMTEGEFDKKMAERQAMMAAAAQQKMVVPVPGMILDPSGGGHGAS